MRLIKPGCCRPLLLALPLFTGLLAGCDSGSSFTSYSNYELSEAWQECKSGGQNVAGAQRCNNIERECQRRKEEKNFRC